MKNENEFDDENLNIVDSEKMRLKKHTIFFTIKIRW